MTGNEAAEIGGQAGGRLAGHRRESDLHPENNGKQLERSNQLGYQVCICTDKFCLQSRKQIEGGIEWIWVDQPGGYGETGAVNRVV